jgi:hypothetical protein
MGLEERDQVAGLVLHSQAVFGKEPSAVRRQA